MAVLVGFLVVGIVCAIAAFFVIREAGRLAAEPIAPTFSLDEAYEWVVENLPDIVAATLTPDDVRRILAWQIEYFERRGVAQNGAEAHVPEAEVVIGDAEVVDYICERSVEEGEALIRGQSYAVLETYVEYMRAIGWAEAQQLAAEGRIAGGYKLADEGGKRLRAGRGGGAPLVTDGPYAEAKDVVGGLFIVNAESYDAAVRIASSCPHVRGDNVVEVRRIEVT